MDNGMQRRDALENPLLLQHEWPEQRLSGWLFSNVQRLRRNVVPGELRGSRVRLRRAVPGGSVYYEMRRLYRMERKYLRIPVQSKRLRKLC